MRGGSRPHRLWLSLILLLPGCVCRQWTYAQTPVVPQTDSVSSITSPPAQRPPAEQETAAGLLKIDVVVTDAEGNLISGLPLKDFTLLENGQVNPILSSRGFDWIHARPDPPVEVILLIDTSNMQFAEASYTEQGVEKFLRQNKGRLTQPVSLFLLSPTGLWVPPQPQPSRDGDALAAYLDHKTKLKAIWRDDKDFEDPFSSLRALALIASLEKRKPGRKLLVSAGPGDARRQLIIARDHQRFFDWIVWFSTLLREARIALYSLSAGRTDLLDPSYQDYLKYLAGADSASSKRT